MSKIELLKTREDVEEYLEHALQFILVRKDTILDSADNVGISKAYAAIAGAMGEENIGVILHPNRTRCLDEYALSDKLYSTFNIPGVLGTALISDYGDIGDAVTTVFLDSLGNGKRSHDAWMQLYDPVKTMDRTFTPWEKVENPILLDLGPANIQMLTAIRLIENTSDNLLSVLKLDHYKNNFNTLAEDIVIDKDVISAKLYALKIAEADQWFRDKRAYGDDWESLPQEIKDALYVSYVNIGLGEMEEKFKASTNSGRITFMPLPAVGGAAGLNHLFNADKIGEIVGIAGYGDVGLIDENKSWIELSQADNDEAAAYREALLKLYPFVVKDGDYDETALDRDNFSDSYLRDRAEMLSWYVTLRYDGVNPDEFNTFAFEETQSSCLFDDVDSNLKVKLGQGESTYIGFGNALANTLVGGEGNDRLYGMTGGDTLSGGDGNDHLEGGKGRDNLFGGDGDDIFFMSGEDTAYDVFDGGDGLDTIQGSAGDDIIRVHQFSWTHSIERITGGGGADIIAGTDLADTIDLTSVTEISGIARIEGGAGEDVIKGSGLADVIYGGSLDNPEDSARDRLEGGAGNDIYHVGRGDIISDSDGQGTIWHDGRQLSSLILTRLAHSDIYFDETADTAAIIDRETGTLSLYSGDDLEISIENFTSGSLGIVLLDEQTDEHSYTWTLAGSGMTDVINQGIYEVDGVGGWGFEHRGWIDRNLNFRCDADEELIDLSWKLLLAGTDNFLITGGSGNDYLQGLRGYDRLEGGEGDDRLMGWGEWLYSNPAFNDTGNILDGGPGDDSLWGAAGPDAMIGGEGNDFLSGVLGRDTLLGDGGDDVLAGGSDSDLLVGGEGQDVLLGDSVLYSITPFAVPGVASSVSFTYFANGAICSLTPVNFSISLYASGLLPSEVRGGDDILDGGGGMDWLEGEAGNDILRGGGGQDTIIGGIGGDRLWGEDGNDVLLGDETGVGTGEGGDDFLNGGAGDDELQGQGGNDLLLGEAGNDRLFGGSGADELDGGPGDDKLTGDEGDDVLSGSDGRDQLWGDAGNDILDSGNDDDMLFGGEGDDFLTGGAGNDTLDGGRGDDRYVLHRGSGIDGISDTAGANTLIFDENTEMEVTFGTVSASGMVIFNPASRDLVIRYGESDIVTIENGRSGGFDFRIGSISYDYEAFLNHVPQFQEYGSGSQKITGSAGNDRIYAGAGNDTVHGDAGNDTITGGTGFDLTFRDFLRRIEFFEKNGIQVSGLSNGGAFSERFYRDTIYGDAGNDALSGGWGDDQLYGGEGDDALHGGRDNDYLQGDAGNDILDGDVGNDTLGGGDGDDILYGGDGCDTLSGDAGKDTLYGGAGDDTISGGTGDDILVGDDGDDCFYGDEGADAIDGGAGRDRIDYSASPAGIEVDLQTGIGAGGDASGDTFKGIEGIGGTSFSDVLIGDDGDNHLGGGGGDDIIHGGCGNDEISGEGLLDGGAGNDLVSGMGILFGGDGDDELVGWSQFSYRTKNVLDGGAGNDELTGHNGHDLLRGGDGDDLLDGGGASAEYGYEPRSFDLLEGGAGNDTYVMTCGIDFVNDDQGINTVRLSGGFWDIIQPEYVTFKLVSVNLDDVSEMMSCVDSWENEEENARLDAFRGKFFNESVFDPATAQDLLLWYEERALVIIGGARDLGYRFEIGDAGDVLSHREVLRNIAPHVNSLPEAESERVYDLLDSCQLFGKINATDVDSDTLEYTIKEKPVGGDLMLESDGRWIYTARQGFVGRDNAIIDIDDGHGDIVSVSFTFNVSVTASSSGSSQTQGWQGVLSEALAAAVSAGSLEFYGTDDSDRLTGSAGDDILVGMAGDDILIGGLGNDILAGGEGSDGFIFDAVPDEHCNHDSIADFVPGGDMIRLDSGIFTKLTGTDVLSDAYFRSGAAGMAEDEDDYILYNTTSGALLYDADGSGQGVAIEIASLTNKPAISASDFLVAA